MCMRLLTYAQSHVCRNPAQIQTQGVRTFRSCIRASDGRAGCYSTSHSKWWRRRVRAAGRQGDRQLFPPHISVQRHHQSLAEMSVLQAGDRPLNVSPSQVNIQTQPASQTEMGGDGGRE